MFETIFTVLSAILDTKTALELTARVAGYISRKSKAARSRHAASGLTADELQALEATYREWEHIAVSLRPAIETVMQRHFTQNLAERAQLLANLTNSYAREEHHEGHRELENLKLYHTAFARTQDGSFRLKFGYSAQTKCLSGEALDLSPADAYAALFADSVAERQKAHIFSGGQMSLPVFKVTMLGSSGAGKTVFMSSMYSQMRFGETGIAIRAMNNNVDLELGENMDNLYEYDKWPPTTDDDEKNYQFELLLRGTPIACIDWVDYRGGSMHEPEESPGGQALIKRLHDSHSIIWMVDMSKLGKTPLGSFPARQKARLGRMANLCRNAAQSKHLRSILFVRTKSDEVQGSNGEPDWSRACTELSTLLGAMIEFDRIPFSAIIPVSSVGRVKDKTLLGENPQNVEWPLILSLAFMMEGDLERLKKEIAFAEQQWKNIRPYETVRIIREILGRGMSDAERQALQQFSDISLQVIGMGEVIKELVKNKPNSIKVIRKDQRQ
jgi:hypothetical protein